MKVLLMDVGTMEKYPGIETALEKFKERVEAGGVFAENGYPNLSTVPTSERIKRLTQIDPTKAACLINKVWVDPKEGIMADISETHVYQDENPVQYSFGIRGIQRHKAPDETELLDIITFDACVVK